MVGGGRKIPGFSLLLCGYLSSFGVRVRVEVWRHDARSSFHYADINARLQSCIAPWCLALFSAPNNTAEAT